MKLKKYHKIIFAILVCEFAGIIGSFFTASSVSTWYLTLEKPFLNPPSSVFGPVWVTLYALMGIAAYLIWEKGIKNKSVKTALSFFGVQLVLNSLWSIIFFGMQNPAGAFFEIIILWLAIVGTTILFYKISKPAAYLLLPYLAWVSFASYLNFLLWTLN